MKKLYALLAILIVIYVGINVVYNGMDTINGLSNFNAADAFKFDNGGKNIDGIVVGTSDFAKLENFTDKKINDNEVSLIDSKRNITIHVKQLDDAKNVKDTVSHLLSTDTEITSNQTILQNDISAYFLYKEGEDTYHADIYFNKDKKNYLISGDDISYDDSDYFINSCKEIINSMEVDDTINYSRY